MRESEVPVTFQPQGTTVHVLRGTRFLEAAAGAGLSLDFPCGGEGICGKCRVIVRRGAGPAGPAERRALTDGELSEGYRLACQISIGEPMTVEIPATSLLGSRYQILAHSEAVQELAADPTIRKKYVELPPPDARQR